MEPLIPAGVLAHGLTDAVLPVPATTVAAGGAVVLAGVAGLLWNRRPAEPAAGGTPRCTPSPVWRAVAGAGAGLVVLLGALGPPDAATNAAPRLLFVLLPAALGIGALLAGPVWPAANPLRALAGWLAVERLGPAPAGADVGGDEGLAPAAPDARPDVDRRRAAAALLVFVWLAVAGGSPVVAAVAVLAAVLTAAAASLRTGTRWLDHWDPFELLTALLAAAAPLRHVDGRRRWTSPRRALRAAPSWDGQTEALAVLLGYAVFDAVSAGPWWQAAVAGAAVPALAAGGGLVACAAGGWLLVRWAAGSAELVPAFVPLVAGYLLVHWLPALVVDAQVVASQLRDPLGLGWRLPIAAPAEPVEPLGPGALAVSAALVLLAGHAAAVVAGHDRGALRRADGRPAATQLPFVGLVTASWVFAVVLILPG